MYLMKPTSKSVVVTLNIVWNIAICVSISGNAAASHLSMGRHSARMKNTIEPNTLNMRCITDARLPLVVAPMEASTAVTQVPMLMPSVRKMELLRSIKPTPAIVIKMLVVAEEL